LCEVDNWGSTSGGTVAPLEYEALMSVAAAEDDIQISILRLPGDASQWELVMRFLELRRKIFIYKKKWRLFEEGAIEFEQYDTATVATYVIAHRNGDILAGLRLLRCDTKIGPKYSYMIRDAYLKRIGIPSEICFEEPPATADSWEITRGISVDKTPQSMAKVLNAVHEFIKSEGGKLCLFLGPVAFVRMAKRAGYQPRRLGNIAEDDSGRFLVLAFDIE